jgi:hypothetical protein
MISIPTQLKNQKFKFILLKSKDKLPVEDKWNSENNYSYDDPKLLLHLQSCGNYGVLGGRGNLIIIDADSEEVNSLARNLPHTMIVKTGSKEEYKKHYYYVCDEELPPIRLSKEHAGDLGDIRSSGQYVVGPSCVHPSGGEYTIVMNNMISNITKAALKNTFNSLTQTQSSVKKDFPIITTKRTDEYIKECRILDHFLNNKGKPNTSKNFTLFKYLVDIWYNRGLDESILKNLAKTQEHAYNAIAGWVTFAKKGQLEHSNCEKMRTYLQHYYPELLKVHCENCPVFKTKTQQTLVEGDYKLKISIYGFLFGKTIYKQKGEEVTTEFKEISTYKNVARQEQILYNPIERKTRKKNQYEFNIENEIYYCDADAEKDIIIMMWKGKRPNYAGICRDDEIAFCKILKKLEPERIESTNVLGYYDGKYHDYPEYVPFNITIEKEGNKYIKKEELFVPSFDYLGFLNEDYDKKIVDKVIDVLNTKYARNKEEKMFHKVILSFCISSMLKVELMNSGIKLHPHLVATGGKELGKSTACRILCSRLFNSPELTIEHFVGSKGARLKHINNDLFPIFVDELTELKAWENTLNTSTTRGYLEIVKGTKEGAMETQQKYFNLIIATNEFETSLAAFDSRLLKFNYEHSMKSADTDEWIIFLEDNIIHLGRYIYANLHLLGVQSIIETLKKDFKGATDANTMRKRDKLLYIKVGEKICDVLGILPSVIIDTRIFFQDTDRQFTINSALTQIIRSYLNQTFPHYFEEIDPPHRKHTIITPQLILREYYVWDEDIFTYFESKGIFFPESEKKNDTILLGSAALKHIEDELRKREYNQKYKSLKFLADDLDLKFLENPQHIKPQSIEKDDDGKTIKHRTMRRCLELDANIFLEQSF